MVVITIVTGVYKPTYNWGAPHCRILRSFFKWDLIGLVYAFDHILTPNMMEIGKMSFNYWIPCFFFVGLVSMLRRIHDSFHQFVVLITVDLSCGISLKCPQAGNFRKGAPHVAFQMLRKPSGWFPKLDSAILKWLPKIGVPKIIHNYSWFITPNNCGLWYANNYS